ncbi:MAG: inositol monophosphatase family protein [Candidatus Woesearchaeota archaeon]
MLEILKDIARRAGNMLEEKKSDKIQIRSKEDATVVTDIDDMLDHFIRRELFAQFPMIPILSEESPAPKDAESFFAVDPLDGTQELINYFQKDTSYTEYSIHIGYAEKGKPKIGVVYFPALDKMYYAEQGKGAFLEEKGQVRGLKVKPSDKIVIGRYNFDDDLVEVLSDRFDVDIEEVPTGGSFGAKVCAVAEGKYGWFVHTNYDKTSTHASLWDSCAPDVILHEAGGISYQVKNLKPIHYTLDEIELTKGYIAKAPKGKVIVFDVDNVLGFFERLRSLRDVAHIRYIANKLDMSYKGTDYLYWETKKNLRKVGRMSTCDTFLELGLTKEDYFISMNDVPVEGHIDPTPHAVEVVEELSKRYDICALTNTPHKATIDTLKYIGVFQYFDRLFTIDEVEYVKPDPRTYEFIMKEMRAKEGIAVGDQLGKDLAPAKEVGLKTIWFPKTSDDHPQADHAITELKGLLKIL